MIGFIIILCGLNSRACPAKLQQTHLNKRITATSRPTPEASQNNAWDTGERPVGSGAAIVTDLPPVARGRRIANASSRPGPA